MTTRASVRQPSLAASRHPCRLFVARKPARTPARRQGCRPHRGGALLAVMWLSAARAAIAFPPPPTVRAETERVGSASEGLRAWYLASGSVDRGIQWMLWGGDYRNPNGTPRFWEFNQPRMYMSYPTGDAVVEVIPEA